MDGSLGREPLRDLLGHQRRDRAGVLEPRTPVADEDDARVVARDLVLGRLRVEGVVPLREAFERRLADPRDPLGVLRGELLGHEVVPDRLDDAHDLVLQAMQLGFVDEVVLACLDLERALQEADGRIAAEERRVDVLAARGRGARAVVRQSVEDRRPRILGVLADRLRGLRRVLVELAGRDLVAQRADVAGDLILAEVVRDHRSFTVVEQHM